MRREWKRVKEYEEEEQVRRKRISVRREKNDKRLCKNRDDEKAHVL